jgi:RNA polymerase sigma-70 factor (sigma-E family)
MGLSREDEDSFVLFVEQHGPSLFRTAVLLCGDRSEAEDLTQDAFADLYARWPRVGAMQSPSAYARRCVVNRFLTAREKRVRRQEIAGRRTARAEVEADIADRVVEAGLAWQLLSLVSPPQRAALVLRYFHDLADRDIAEMIGCRPATVRSLTSRGLATMRAAAPHAVAHTPGPGGR